MPVGHWNITLQASLTSLHRNRFTPKQFFPFVESPFSSVFVTTRWFGYVQQKYFTHFATTPWIKHCSGALQNLIIYVYDFIVQSFSGLWLLSSLWHDEDAFLISTLLLSCVLLQTEASRSGVWYSGFILLRRRATEERGKEEINANCMKHKIPSKWEGRSSRTMGVSALLNESSASHVCEYHFMST